MAKFWLVDTETTGLNADKNQILEVGMMAIDKDLQVLDFDTFLIKHNEYTLDAKAIKANGISLLETERYGLTVDKAVERVLNFVCENKPENDRLIFMGQNCPFDSRFMEKLFLSSGRIKEYRQCVGYHQFDLMGVSMYETVKGNINLDHFNLDVVSENLGVHAQMLDIEGVSSARHRALYDCLLELNCFQKFLNIPLTSAQDMKNIQNRKLVGNLKKIEPVEVLLTNDTKNITLTKSNSYVFALSPQKADKAKKMLEENGIYYQAAKKENDDGKSIIIFKIRKEDRGRYEFLKKQSISTMPTLCHK